MTGVPSRTAIFTRAEFYEKVWSEPSTKLAKEFGLSNVMIGKICKKHSIPKPYRGYWPRFRRGWKPSRTPLKELTDPRLQSVSITIREKNDREVSDPTLKTRITLERSARNIIRVKKHLNAPHESIEHTRAAIKLARPDKYGLLYPAGPHCLDVNVCAY